MRIKKDAKNISKQFQSGDFISIIQYIHIRNNELVKTGRRFSHIFSKLVLVLPRQLNCTLMIRAHDVITLPMHQHILQSMQQYQQNILCCYVKLILQDIQAFSD